MAVEAYVSMLEISSPPPGYQSGSGIDVGKLLSRLIKSSSIELTSNGASLASIPVTITKGYNLDCG